MAVTLILAGAVGAMAFGAVMVFVSRRSDLVALSLGGDLGGAGEAQPEARVTEPYQGFDAEAAPLRHVAEAVGELGEAKIVVSLQVLGREEGRAAELHRLLSGRDVQVVAAASAAQRHLDCVRGMETRGRAGPLADVDRDARGRDHGVVPGVDVAGRGAGAAGEHQRACQGKECADLLSHRPSRAPHRTISPGEIWK